MSNSFTTPPVLADESTVVAGQAIAEGAISLMSETTNYLWAYGGTHNLVSQSWAEGQFQQSLTTFQQMIEYKIPMLSVDHLELHIHYIALGAGSIRATLTNGTDVYTDTITTTGAGPHVVESTISLTSVPLSSSATLGFELRSTSGTPPHIEIRTLAAHWVAPSSPLSAGATSDFQLNQFIPFGINRVGADYPLSARWGVDMTNNIETLRRRPISYVSWSGVDNLGAVPTSDTDPAPALYLGVGDIEVLFPPVYIPQEAFVSGNFYTINIWIKMANLNPSLPSVTYIIMGQEIEVTTNGWSYHQVTVRPDQDEDLSQKFNLSLYRVGLDDDPQNWDYLLNISSNPSTTSTWAYIQALSIWGV